MSGTEFPTNIGETAPRTAPQRSAPSTRPSSQWGAMEQENTTTKFYTRSRTNTLASKARGHRIAQSSSSTLTSHRSSWDAETVSDSINAPIDRYEGLAQILRDKTSKLWRRRQSRHSRAGTSLEYYGEKTLLNHAPVLPAQDFLKHTRFVSAGNQYPGSRPNISIPYNFQHLTHTHSQQFQSLDKASEEELASELSAIQAMQTSQRRLQGITAQDLSTQSSACPSPVRQAPYSPALSSPTSVYSNANSNMMQFADAPPRTPPPHDYFTRHPSSVAYSPEVPAATPPHTSSVAAVPPLFSSPQAHEQSLFLSTTHDVDTRTPVEQSPTPYITAPQTPSDMSQHSWDFASAPHAMTTPDDSAYLIKPVSHQALLADVPEEDDSRSTTVRGSRPSTPGSGIRHAKSVPNIITSAPCQEYPHSPVIGNMRPFLVNDCLSQSHALPPFVGHPFDDIPAHPGSPRPISCSPLPLDPSWEDDVDFCYEHAAEADCDFDWSRVSLEKDCTERYDSVDMPQALQIRKRSCSSPHQLPRLQTSLSTSNLSLTNSANSSIASIGGPITPANPFIISVTNSHRKASVVSPLVYDEQTGPSPDGTQYTNEHVYPISRFRFDPPVEDRSVRSSRSPISKSNSHESFWSSRPSSASKCKETASVESLPELVHSNRSSNQNRDPPRDDYITSLIKEYNLKASQHGTTRSEPINDSPQNTAVHALRKRSATTTANVRAVGSKGSLYSPFPPLPSVKIMQ